MAVCISDMKPVLHICVVGDCYRHSENAIFHPTDSKCKWSRIAEQIPKWNQNLFVNIKQYGILRYYTSPVLYSRRRSKQRNISWMCIKTTVNVTDTHDYVMIKSLNFILSFFTIIPLEVYSAAFTQFTILNVWCRYYYWKSKTLLLYARLLDWLPIYPYIGRELINLLSKFFV